VARAGATNGLGSRLLFEVTEGNLGLVIAYEKRICVLIMHALRAIYGRQITTGIICKMDKLAAYSKRESGWDGGWKVLLICLLLLLSSSWGFVHPGFAT